MIVVYGLRVGKMADGVKVESKVFSDLNLTAAMAFCRDLRDQGCVNCTISSEPGDMVGGFGVDSVEDGKTPDGHDYEWSKKQRGDGPRKD